MIVGLAREGTTVLRTALGMASVELAAPLSPDMVFPICSITKQMTSLCALRLAEAGLLDLDAPIGAYAPELAEPARRPTLTQLMTHQSGLHCFHDVTALDPIRAPRPDRFALWTLARLESVCAPAGAWQVYCPSGHFLLSIAMERVTDLPFDEVLKRWVFDPLGMTRSANVDFPKSIVPGSPAHYERRADGAWALVTEARYEFLGEGGVYAPLDDLLTWAAALRTEDARISRSLWKQMKTPPSLPNGQASNYGLGLQVLEWRGQPLYGHGGGCPGIDTYLLSAPSEGIDIVVLANGPIPAQSVARALLDAAVGGPPDEPVRPDRKEHLDLSGRTFIGPGYIVEFQELGGGLGARVSGNPAAPVSISSSDDADFHFQALTTRHEFKREGDAIRVRANGEDHLCLPVAQSSNASDCANDAVGEFRNDALESRLTLSSRTDGGRLFEYSGRYGRTQGAFKVIAPDILRLMNEDGVSLGIHLRLDRRRDTGRVDGFHYETSRTRGLYFERST